MYNNRISRRIVEVQTTVTLKLLLRDTFTVLVPEGSVTKLLSHTLQTMASAHNGFCIAEIYVLSALVYISFFLS